MPKHLRKGQTMGILQAISRLMDLKIVQWGMLAAVAVLLTLAGVQTFRLQFAHLQVSTIKSELAKVNAQTLVQTASIDAWKREGELAKAKVKTATEAAAKVAMEYDAKLTALRSKPIREDCCGAIEDAKNIILGVK